MTVKELIEISPNCDTVEIVVREQATHNEYMYDINCYPEGFVPEKEQPSAEQKAAVMQGQMSLEELGIV